MADTVIFEDGDDLSESNIGQFFGQPNMSDYVVRGVSSSIDYGNNTVDYTAGDLVVLDGGTNQAYFLSPDARSGLSLTDSATNYVFVEYDPATDDSITFTINTTGTSPTDPHVKIEEIDTSADTNTEFNRNPDKNFDEFTVATLKGLSTNDVTDLEGTNLSVDGSGVLNVGGIDTGSTQADTGTITASGGSTPAADVTATGVSINQDGDYWVLVYVDADPSFNADYKFNWEYSHNWNDTGSAVDLDFTVVWDTDPGAGNDVTLRWEVRQP